MIFVRRLFLILMCFAVVPLLFPDPAFSQSTNGTMLVAASVSAIPTPTLAPIITMPGTMTPAAITTAIGAQVFPLALLSPVATQVFPPTVTAGECVVGRTGCLIPPKYRFCRLPDSTSVRCSVCRDDGVWQVTEAYLCNTPTPTPTIQTPSPSPTPTRTPTPTATALYGACGKSAPSCDGKCPDPGDDCAHGPAGGCFCVKSCNVKAPAEQCNDGFCLNVDHEISPLYRCAAVPVPFTDPPQAKCGCVKQACADSFNQCGGGCPGKFELCRLDPTNQETCSCHEVQCGDSSPDAQNSCFGACKNPGTQCRSNGTKCVCDNSVCGFVGDPAGPDTGQCGGPCPDGNQCMYDKGTKRCSCSCGTVAQSCNGCEICSNNTCSKTPTALCSKDSDCGPATNLRCVGCTCGCESPADCRRNEFCSRQGYCEPYMGPINCSVNTDCPLYTECDETTNTCIPAFATGCITSDQCVVGKVCLAGDCQTPCVNGTSPGCNDGACESPELCVSTGARCGCVEGCNDSLAPACGGWCDTGKTCGPKFLKNSEGDELWACRCS